MEKNQNNWEENFRTYRSNMLEDTLPYLPMNVKKAAALYIKLEEIQNISSDFDTSDTLQACGFAESSNTSMEEVLHALKLRAPSHTSKRIDEMLQILKLMKIMPVLMAQNSPTNQSDFQEQLNQILQKRD